MHSNKFEITYFDLTNLKNSSLPTKIEKVKMLFWHQKNILYCEGISKNLQITNKDNSITNIKLPSNFYSNGANIPYFLQKIFPPVGKNYESAAFYHDFLYSKRSKYSKFSRLKCDIIFYKIMKLSGVNIFIRSMFFLAVRIFGGSSYESQ